jgi:hypothetical protein
LVEQKSVLLPDAELLGGSAVIVLYILPSDCGGLELRFKFIGCLRFD